MRVISLKRLWAFWVVHPDAEQSLRHWYHTTLHAEWSSLADVRSTYPHADGVGTEHSGTWTVFNIGGTKDRLIARMRDDFKLVNVRCVLTHTQYGGGAWKR